MIQRLGERKDAGTTDAAPGRLEARQPVHGRGEADRAAGIGPQGREAESGRRGRPRARRGGSRPIGGVPGVERRGDGGVMRTVSALGHLQLAEDHGPRLFEARHNGRVRGRNVGAMDRHAGGGRDALGVAKVLHCDGYPVQRTARAPSRRFGIEPPGVGQRAVGGHGRVALEPRIDLANSVQHRPREFGGRQLARLQAARDLVERQIVQVGWHADFLTATFP